MHKPKVLVLGGSGCLGSAIMQELSFMGIEYIGTSSRRINENDRHNQSFTVGQNLDSLIADFNPDVIINCIVNKMDDMHNLRNIASMFRVNSYFPHQLAKVSKPSKTRVIQISTNSIFSGNRGNYTEDSITFPKNLYSASKLFGESKLENVSNIRVSFVSKEIARATTYNSMEWLIKASSNSPAHGFTNHLWNGLTDEAVAKLLATIINTQALLERLPQTFHLFTSEQISKYELCEFLLKHFHLPSNYLLPSNATKPKNLTLSSNHLNYSRLIWKEVGFNKIPRFKDLF